MVLWVNRRAERADLLAVQQNPYPLADVPFARLRPYEDLIIETD